MPPLITAYATLTIAIIAEVTGTYFLAKSEQFTRLAPTLWMIACYVVSFYMLTLTLRYLPLGIAYAIWAGLGIVLTSMIGFFMFKQSLDAPALLGISMIVMGTVIINVFSKSVVD